LLVQPLQAKTVAQNIEKGFFNNLSGDLSYKTRTKELLKEHKSSNFQPALLIYTQNSVLFMEWVNK
jgi:hypothetical protein